MFPGFETRQVPTERGALHARIGGAGPPLLLLHGYPQTHLMWHAVAPLLAGRHTVVVPDLPGYGASFRPAAAETHEPHGKRRIGEDLIAAMASLGFERFAVAGHDRGGRVAYRMALDHHAAIERLAVLDIVPTGEVYGLPGYAFASGYWHWAFLAQPSPLPERLIGAAPGDFFDLHVRGGMGLGVAPGRYPREVMDAYRSAFDDAGAVAGMCEDYRAGASVDRSEDDADRAAGRRIGCPTLALWASRGSLPKLYDDVLDVWRRWADDVRGGPIEAGHFLAEDQPEDVAAELLSFFGSSSVA
jgi:haloacetate dehalogenase